MVNHPGAFIALEGLRGSGKSTIAGHLADVLGLTQVTVIEDAFAPILGVLDDDPGGLDARHAAYAAAVMRCGRRVEAAVRSSAGCIVDSWIDRTNLTHAVLGSTLEVLEPAWLPRPDVTVWLDVPDAVRAQRITARRSPEPYWKRRLEEHSDRLAEMYRAHCPDLVPIDASGPVEDVVSSAATAALARLEDQHVPLRTH